MREIRKTLRGGRLLTGLLCVGIGALLVPVMAEETSAKSKAAGTETGNMAAVQRYDEDGALLIWNAKDLLDLMHGIRGWDNLSHYRLAADIDLDSCEGQNPIGKSGKAFMGTFDGAGHTISGLKIEVTTPSGDAAGLFGVTQKAVIRDLTVEGTVMSEGNYVGGLIGRSADGLTLENVVNRCSVRGSISVGGLVGMIVFNVDSKMDVIVSGCVNEGTVEGGDCAGGIAGRLRSVSANVGPDCSVILKNCVNSGTIKAWDSLGGIAGQVITGSETNEEILVTTIRMESCRNRGPVTGQYMVGGIAGVINGGRPCENQPVISGCTNSGNVTMEDMTDAGIPGKPTAFHGYTGGILGCQITATVSDSINTGSVAAVNQYVGGVVGTLKSGTVSGCTNRGPVTAGAAEAKKSETDYAGGIVGYIDVTRKSPEGLYATVSGCVNEGNVSGRRYLGGIVGDANTANSSDPTVPDCPIRIIECRNSGSLTGAQTLGGILGLGHDAVIGGSITEIRGCVNDGQLLPYGEGDGVALDSGGIVGALISGSVTDCVNEADITIRQPSGGHLGGVLGFMESGTIKNCANKGDIAATMCRSVGGVAGCVRPDHYLPGSSSMIDGCANEGEVNGYQYVGGIAGFSDTCMAGDKTHANCPVTITTCTNHAMVSGDDFVGGIAGYFFTEHEGEGQSELTYCLNEGTVSASGRTDLSANAGGIAGRLKQSNVTGCLNRGKVVSPHVRIGGIIGYAENVDGAPYAVSDNLNTGAVDSTVSEKGAIIGNISSRDGLTLKNNFYTGGPANGFDEIYVNSDELDHYGLLSALYEDGGSWIYTINGPEIRSMHVHQEIPVIIPGNDAQHQLECICDEYEGNHPQNHSWDASGKRCTICGYVRS